MTNMDLSEKIDVYKRQVWNCVTIQRDSATVSYTHLAEELSGIGAAYMAGISAGLYSEEELFSGWEGSIFTPSMDVNVRREKLNGWKKAVAGVLDHT